MLHTHTPGIPTAAELSPSPPHPPAPHSGTPEGQYTSKWPMGLQNWCTHMPAPSSLLLIGQFCSLFAPGCPSMFTELPQGMLLWKPYLMQCNHMNKKWEWLQLMRKFPLIMHLQSHVTLLTNQTREYSRSRTS